MAIFMHFFVSVDSFALEPLINVFSLRLNRQVFEHSLCELCLRIVGYLWVFHPSMGSVFIDKSGYK